MVPFVLCLGVASLAVYGAIQAQNLESRAWGITGSILIMLPMTCGGVWMMTVMGGQYLFGAIMDDPGYIMVVIIIMLVVEWLGCVASGVWALKLLMDKDVIAGFEYEPE